MTKSVKTVKVFTKSVNMGLHECAPECHFRIWVDSDLSLSLIQVDSGLTLLLVKVDFRRYPCFWLFPRSYPVQGLTGGRSPEGDP